jgi:SNF2 family DNA or RNA helicase
MDAMTDKKRTHEELIKIYQGLSEADKVIAQALSVIYTYIAKTPLMNCLKKIGFFLKTNQGNDFKLKDFNPILKELLKKQIIEISNEKSFMVNPLIRDYLTLQAINEGIYESIGKNMMKLYPARRDWGGEGHYKSNELFFRNFRFYFYLGDFHQCVKLADVFSRHIYNEEEDPYKKIMPGESAGELLNLIPLKVLSLALEIPLVDSLYFSRKLSIRYEKLCKKIISGNSKQSDFIRFMYIGLLILQGKLQKAEGLITNETSKKAVIAFLKGNNEKSIELFEQYLKDLKKADKKATIFDDEYDGIFYILSLIKSNTDKNINKAQKYILRKIKSQKKRYYGEFSSEPFLFRSLIKTIRGNAEALNEMKSSYSGWQNCPFYFYLNILCDYWKGSEEFISFHHDVSSIAEYFRNNEFLSIARDLYTILSRLLPEEKEYSKNAEELESKLNFPGLTDFVNRMEPWKISLKALMNISLEETKQISAVSNERLIWRIGFDEKESLINIHPVLQKISKSGVWTKGRPIALKHLYKDPDTFNFLTEKDKKICATIVADEEYTGFYRNRWRHVYYKFDIEKALPHLAGHPYCFWDFSPLTKVEIVKSDAELKIYKKRDKIILKLLPFPLKSKNYQLLKETPTKIKFVKFTPEQINISEIISEDGISVPQNAGEMVKSAIESISRNITVQSDIESGNVDVEEIKASSIPVFHIFPYGDGLKVELLVRPFGEKGRCYLPGKGGKILISEIDGKRFEVKRNLKEEKKLSEEIIRSCKCLDMSDEIDGEWKIEDPEDCLELLLELESLGERTRVEWPRGESLKITHRAGFKQFRVSVRKKQDWFSMTGELKLDNDLILDMKKVISMLNENTGRFIEISKGKFLALTREFRKRLDDLNTFSEKDEKGIRFHPLAYTVFEEIVENAEKVSVDKNWKDHLKRIDESLSLKPKLPSTLQADLRDYQVEGFNWLSRLAHLGAGACLADDMGLGKTLQALSVILCRAKNGPTLVIAPTSVARNWESEAQHFAPTLQPQIFGMGNRKKMIKNAGPFDLILCTYGLLHQESKLLESKHWETIVLDEAQAIKNMSTKRSKAAMKLDGGFKIITTGTPIENHLGELWNLFRFINPGLLGSHERFNKIYAVPIEKFGDRQIRNRLKKLIQPFILRRKKSQVLEELPPRTEILHRVEMSPDEMAFYEALRISAVENLENQDDPKSKSGVMRIRILAEIMRLRRACCNPKLITNDSTIQSSKLSEFEKILDEMLENHHKALVFSQFVGHLSILRELLDKKGIKYQYLDGSVSQKERKKRVDAFQSGEGEVFLISLRAGGLGLNLTAADYVIHMDPWWNPAVEDQASDRAHRIGQHRPVTVYRLIAKNTIEEKIVDLHSHKRDLADRLLEGSDMSGKMSTEDLLRLLKDVEKKSVV